MDFEVVETIKEEGEEETCVMESLCRVCACFSELLLPIFDGEGLKHDLPDKIKQHLPITVKNSDRLPLKICYQCASTVISWHDLVTSCRNADQKLRTLLKSSGDQLQNSSEDVDAADVTFSGEVYDLNTDETESSLRNIGSNMKSDEQFTTNLEMRDGAMASMPSEGGNPERCIGLTEDCGEKLIEEKNMGNLISLRFGPQIDHSYTRLPSSEPPVAPKAVKPDPPRSLRPILPKPRETVITSVFNSQISVSTKSSVVNVTDHNAGSVSPKSPEAVVTPLSNTEISVSTESSEVNVTDHLAESVIPKPLKTGVTPVCSPQISVSTKSSVASVKDNMSGSAPQFLFCTEVQKGVSNHSKKAVLVPLSNVRKAMTTTQPNVQKTTASLKSKSSLQRLSVLKKSHPNVSVTITPVQKVSRSKPLNVGPSLPSLTITPLQRKPSTGQYRHVSKSLTGEKTMRFTCRVCNAEFLHEVVRRLHMFRSHGLKQYMCDICNTGFGMSHELKAHMRKQHVMEKRENPETPLKYPCNLCNLSFLWHRDLLLHKREKHPNLVKTVSMEQKKEKKVVAGVEVSEKEKEMLKEFHTVIDSRDWYHCKECMKSWQSRDKAVLHIRTHTKERMYACEICDQKFNTPGVLRRHLQVHGGKKPFPCAYCEKTFSSKQNRDDHHRFHTKEVKTVCETCGEFLTSASMLYYHRKIHSGITPYVCPYCNKAYAIRALLKRHIRFHTGEKPHLCSVCGRGFNTSGQLRGHSLVHTDSRPFSCDRCGVKMKSTKYLNRHKAICQSSRAKYLQEMKLEGISVKLICDICNLTFTDSSYFADHCKSAHPLSPSSHTVCFVCHICSDTFETDVELRSHLHVKHVFDCIDVKSETSKEEVCQNCKFCGRIFRHPAILSMHSESCRKLNEQFFNDNEFCDYVSFDHSVEEPSSFIVETKFRNVARRGSHNSSYSGLKGRICIPSGKGGLTCKLCKKKFSKESDLNIHVNNCSLVNQNKDNCVVNGDKSQNLNRALLFKNMQSKMGLKDERVACAYCMKSFNSKFDAILHVRKIHSTKVDEFIVWLERRKVFLRSKMCSWCDKVFQNREEADEHFQSLHKEENEKKDWSCELCLLKLSNESELINHIADNGACIKELKSRHVDLASEDFSNGDEIALDSLEFQRLNVHELKVDQQVTESKLGQENSESAGKQNCGVGGFLVNVATGEPDGPISADMLSDSFCTPDLSDPCVSGLGNAKFDIEEDSQISMQHTESFSPAVCADSTEKTPYVCDACGKTFKGKASLFIHRKAHKDHFRHLCEYCQKKFRWRRQLLKHLAIHKDEKRHHCRICGKGFAFRVSLRKHGRIHTKVKPFKCHVCSLLFGQEQYLLNHLKYQHGIQQFQSIEEVQE